MASGPYTTPSRYTGLPAAAITAAQNRDGSLNHVYTLRTSGAAGISRICAAVTMATVPAVATTPQ